MLHGRVGKDKANPRRPGKIKLPNNGNEVIAVRPQPVQPDDAGLRRDSAFDFDGGEISHLTNERARAARPKVRRSLFTGFSGNRRRRAKRLDHALVGLDVRPADDPGAQTCRH